MRYRLVSVPGLSEPYQLRISLTLSAILLASVCGRPVMPDQCSGLRHWVRLWSVPREAKGQVNDGHVARRRGYADDRRRSRVELPHGYACRDVHALADVRGARDGAPRDGRRPAAHRPAAATTDRCAHPAQPRPAAGGAAGPRRRAHLARSPRPPRRPVVEARRPAHAGRDAARRRAAAAAPGVRAHRVGGRRRSRDRPRERGRVRLCARAREGGARRPHRHALPACARVGGLGLRRLRRAPRLLRRRHRPVRRHARPGAAGRRRAAGRRLGPASSQ